MNKSRKNSITDKKKDIITQVKESVAKKVFFSAHVLKLLDGSDDKGSDMLFDENYPKLNTDSPPKKTDYSRVVDSHPTMTGYSPVVDSPPKKTDAVVSNKYNLQITKLQNER